MQQHDLNELQKKIGLGLDAEAFMRSDLGMYLLGRAEMDAIDAINELKAIDASQTDRIRALQSIIARSENFEIWIREAFEVGKASEVQLELMETQD